MSSTFETVAGIISGDRRHPAGADHAPRATRSTISASTPSPSSTSPSRSTRLSASSCRSSSGRRRSTRARSRPRNTSCSRTSWPASTPSSRPRALDALPAARGAGRGTRPRIAGRVGLPSGRIARLGTDRHHASHAPRIFRHDRPGHGLRPRRQADRGRARPCPTQSPVFEGHFPGHPLVPGVLLTETMAQASGYLVLGLIDFTQMPFLMAVDKARFRTFVGPGAELAIAAEPRARGFGLRGHEGEDRRSTASRSATRSCASGRCRSRPGSTSRCAAQARKIGLLAEAA